MAVMSPATAGAFSRLRESLYLYLDNVEFVVEEKREDAELLAIARTALPTLVGALRAMLAAHRPDQRGHCASCCRRGLSFRPQRWPCPVVEAAYDFLKDSERVCELGGLTA